MKTIETAEANGTLAEYASQVHEDPVVVTDHGRPVAVLLALDNVDVETVSLSTNPKFIELIERCRARHKSEGGISSDEMRNRLGVDTQQDPGGD